MGKGDHLGEAEHLILLAVWGLGPDADGPAIRDAVEARTRREMTLSAIYVTLVRLEKKGLVSSRLGDPTPVRGGKARRWFTVEPSGIRALHAARARLDRMWELAPASRRPKS